MRPMSRSDADPARSGIDSTAGNTAPTLAMMVGKAAPMAQAWLALAQVSLQLGDTTGARAAAESTLALAPGQGEAQRLLEGISRR